MNIQERIIGAGLCCALLTVAGCNNPATQSGDDRSHATDQPPTLKSLDETVRAMGGGLRIAMDQSTRLLFRIKSREDRTFATGVFDPTDATYQRVDAPRGFGSFAVAVRDVRDLGDGVRVKLNIGNPGSAGFSNVKLRVKYGPRYSPADTGTEKSAAEVELGASRFRPRNWRSRIT